MNRKCRTLPEIRRDGYRALIDQLGPADALRFIQMFEPGRGDYTNERRQWLDDLTIDELIASIDARNSNT